MSSGSKKQDNKHTVSDVIIISVMAALIVLAALWVYLRAQDEGQEPVEDMTTQAQVEEDSTPVIENADDLQTAEQYLEDLDIEGGLNTKELDDTLN